MSDFDGPTAPQRASHLANQAAIDAAAYRRSRQHQKARSSRAAINHPTAPLPHAAGREGITTLSGCSDDAGGLVTASPGRRS